MGKRKLEGANPDRPGLACLRRPSGGQTIVYGNPWEGDELLAFEPDVARRIAYEGARGVGYAVASTGDVDGDGFEDLTAGCPWWLDQDGHAVGGALVISGADWSVLIRIRGTE